MNLLLVAEGERAEALVRELRALHAIVEVVTPDLMLTRIKLTTGLLADAIVIDGASIDPLGEGFRLRAVLMTNAVRTLPGAVAMPDGRKWKRIPVVAVRRSFFNSKSPHPHTVTPMDFDPEDREPRMALDDGESILSLVAGEVQAYRAELLSQYDDIGFAITFANGRYYVNPAVQPRTDIENDYYYGPADQRPRGMLWMIERDLVGMEDEIAKFEWLINKKGLHESDLQKFFEQHPHFLVSIGGGGTYPLAHPRMEANGQTIVPDFMLRPGFAASRDANWTALDLKLPAARVTVKKGLDVRFSADVVDAVAQLQRYGDFFANPHNREAVEQTLGRHLRYPRLAVLIGRASSEERQERLSFAQRNVDVQIIPYDELLEIQRGLYDIEASGRG